MSSLSTPSCVSKEMILVALQVKRNPACSYVGQYDTSKNRCIKIQVTDALWDLFKVMGIGV